MYTIKNIENEIVINKSKFITNLISVDSVSDALNELNNIKNKYKDATHNTYAYIIDNTKKFSDDKEPNGTAGKPILDVLMHNDLNHVLCVVTRYFGGIKLGANNLLRAYSNSVSDAINMTNKLKLINGYDVLIKFSYDKEKLINNLLNDYNIINKSYDEVIAYNIVCDNTLLNKLKELNIDINIKKETILKIN